MLTLFLCGDVMLGRGVDQILPNPGDPSLREGYIRDARRYVELAEAANGPIPRPVDFSWPWGEALPLLDENAPDVRVVNLETSVTRSEDFAAAKAVHYRMSPANIGCLTAGRPDACVLANNHVMDFGRRGLAETIEVMTAAGLTGVGAGRDDVEAWRPAVIPVDRGRRVVVFAFGMPSSGVPAGWAASGTGGPDADPAQRADPGTPGADRGHPAGVAFLPGASAAAADQVIRRVRGEKRPGDVVVASIHWGSNWGYRVPREHIGFAHRLIDGGVDLVHGHSSHHPRPIEVYRGKLILYGCGDTIDDYEGIGGYEEFRDDLRLLYLVTVRPETGELVTARMAAMRARRMRLQVASGQDARWLAEVLSRVSRGFGVRVELAADGMLSVRPG